MSTHKNRFIITGTGRCGTRFTSHLVRSLGLNCGHEDVFTFKHVLRGQPVRWGNYHADSSWMAVPKLHRSPLPVVLVVRHPLTVAQSMLELGWFRHTKRLDIAKIIYRFRPEIEHEADRLNKVMSLWWHWNATALAHASHVITLESTTVEKWQKILKKLGHGNTVPTSTMEQIHQDPVKANLKQDVRRDPVDNVKWSNVRTPLARAVQKLWDTCEDMSW